MTSPATDVSQQISTIVGSDRVVLFMKGNRQAPQCGFSAQVIQILDRVLPSYTTFDVLSDMDVREAIKEYSDWPTIPQLYIDGEFQGGCDIVREMYEKGELHQALGLPLTPIKSPEIHLSEPAVQVLLEAQSQYPGQELHLSIDSRFQHALGFGPASGHETVVEVGGARILLDRDSAGRADGLRIDVDPASGNRLQIDNPNQPVVHEQDSDADGSAVRSMSVQELRNRLDQVGEHRLLDVRTKQERARAQIEGSELLDQECVSKLMKLPKDTPLIFYCHHGGRSQIAAERFAEAGFTEVFNVTGGIEAWSTEIDSKVPRY